MFYSIMNSSMMRKARKNAFLDFKAYNLRDWTYDNHKTTDDTPYGGGHGQVMKCEPVFEAVHDITQDSIAESGSSAKPYVIFLTPHGEKFSDDLACELSTKDSLLFVCGHYEGFDERCYTLADKQISIGDYVLTSGELASLVVIDAVVRKIPGVLGNENGPLEDSFADGLLEYPQYTRPAIYNDLEVPQVLLSGHHANISEWRRKQSLARTKELRPDLLENAQLSKEDIEFLKNL